MEALEHMIGSLKSNKAHLEQTIREKEDIIVSLESQVYTFRSSAHDRSEFERELHELRIGKTSAERQIGNLTKANQELSLEVNHLRNQISTLNLDIQ
jgi:predicted RNase H-like nuclease (RuvC/YqgF family)